MRFGELRPCDACREPLGVSFFRVCVEQHVVDMEQARTRHAMDTMFPGAPGIAGVFADAEENTKAASTTDLILCVSCLADSGRLTGAWDNAGDDKKGSAS